MTCFNCGCNLAEDESRLCRLCGMRMPKLCTSCPTMNPEFAVCCMSCGAKLSDSQTRQTSQNTLIESRRNVAVLFADVSGFTALSEKLDPEEVRSLINDCFQTITKPVYELEGTIDKYIGDCVMVLFGARYPHSDDPVRAVNCAQSMLVLIREFSEERLAARGLSLTLSIGINYGIVVTGSVGNYYDKDYTVMGDVVNTAQRLQTAAASGTILVSESVREEARDAYEFIDFGTIPVKNRREPVHCFTPANRKQYPETNQPLLERSTQLIELTVNLMSSTAARGALVLGGPGLGKTTLAKAFVEEHHSWKTIWVESSTTYRNRAYHAVSGILHGIMNIGAEESSQAKQARLTSYGYYLYGDSAHEHVDKMVNFLGLLMGIDRTRDFQAVVHAMRHEDLEREIVSQTAAFLLAVSRRQPCLVVVDNFQWADASSVVFFSDLVPQLSGTIFLLFMTRLVKPEWGRLTGFLPMISLDPLSRNGTLMLAQLLLSATALDELLETRLLQVTQGNPMRIVEWIRAMERKKCILSLRGTASLQIDSTVDLPTTLESLVLSALSDLSADALAFVQTAAVMGSEFRLSWLADMLQSTAEAEILLAQCVDAGLVVTRSVSAGQARLEKVCAFRYESTRESILGSILNKNRMVLHLQFADYLEQSTGGDREASLSLLHEHYEAAGFIEKADLYLFRLAEKQRDSMNDAAAISSFSRLATRDSCEVGMRRLSYIACSQILVQLSQYEEAVAMCTAALQQQPTQEERYELFLMLAEVQMEMAKYPDALELINDMELRLTNNPKYSGKLLRLKCTILRLQSDSKALSYARHAIAVLKKTQDSYHLSEVLSQAAYMHFARGSVAHALKEMDQAFGIAEKANHLGQMARLSGNLGIIHHSSGSVARAMTYLVKAIDLAGKVSNRHSQVSSRINLGILHMEKGQFHLAQEQLEMAIEMALSMGLTYHVCLAHLNLGDLAMERGDAATAKRAYQEALQLAEKHGLPCETALAKLGLYRVTPFDKIDSSMPTQLDQLRAVFVSIDEYAGASDVEQFSVKLHLSGKKTKARQKLAQAACQRALQDAEQSENRLCLLRARRLTGTLLGLSGDIDAAIALLSDVVGAAYALESDYETAKVEYRLAQLLMEHGQEHEASSHLRAAVRCIEQTDDSKWKQMILAAGSGLLKGLERDITE